MDIEQTSSSCSEKLLELMTKTFPQFKFPEIQYEEKTEDDGSISCNARVKVLGQSFSSGPQPSKAEALEAVSSLVYEVVKEFQRLVLSETDTTLNCEALSSLFRPLKEEAIQVSSTPTQEALRSVTAIKNRLVEVENEKINLKVKNKKEQIIEKMQGPVQMEVSAPAPVSVPVPSPISAPVPAPGPSKEVKSSNAPISLSPLNIEDASSLSKPKERERKTNLGAPIPAIYEYVEKQSSKDPIVFDDFVKGQFFGCRLRWGKKFWVAPAENRQKKDAHNYAAVMACVESFGEGFTFEGVDPRIYFKWTRESVRQASDKYSFGLSDELAEQGSAKLSEPVDVSKIKIDPLADGRKFTSVLNEICQKMRFTPPNYQVSSVNALTNYYVCAVRNFHNLPLIESIPFTKKNESKEDAAGKIYYLLEQQGIVDEASRIIGRQKVMEAAASAFPPQRSPPMMQNAPVPIMPNLHPEIPPGTSSNPNFNMMQMMPMFMMTQMSQQQQQQAGGTGFDPQMMQNFDGMMKQWQAFLAWQQYQQGGPGSAQSSQPHSPNQQGQGSQQNDHQGAHHDAQRNVHHDAHRNGQYDPNGSNSSRNPPRQNDNYSNSRKRNYEESRRRYYD